MSRETITERLDKYTIPEPNTGCFLWIGPLNSDGYGALTIEKRVCRAHRLAYEAVNGAIADGMFICHRCDVRHCVNPAHLFLGTAADNNHDMMRKGRHRSDKKPECPKGHTLDGDNTRTYKNGKRQCRRCEAARRRAYFSAHREGAREQCRAYRAAHPDRVAAYEAARTARAKKGSS